MLQLNLQKFDNTNHCCKYFLSISKYNGRLSARLIRLLLIYYKMKSILIAVLVGFQIFGCSNTHYVILMGGQSNMVGAGEIYDIGNSSLPDNIKYYDYGMAPGFKVHPSDQFGPEIGLSQVLSTNYPDKKFILIKYAIGGASMLNWSPDYDSLKAKVTGTPALFGNMYKAFNDKTDSILQHVKHTKVALLWIQGERDARIPEAAVDFYVNFKNLIESIRIDSKNSDLPIIFGRINPPVERYSALDIVREGQEMIVNNLSNTFLIETDDLEKWDDDVHYSSNGQLELGRRFGEHLIVILEYKIHSH